MIVNICSPRGGEEGDGHLGLGKEILHVLGQVVNIPVVTKMLARETFYNLSNVTT